MIHRQNKLCLESAAIAHEQGAAEKERVEIARLESIYPYDPQLRSRKARLNDRFKSLGYRGSMLGDRRSALKLDIAAYQVSKAPAMTREVQSDLAGSSSRLLAHILTSTTLQDPPQSQASHSASAASVPWLQNQAYPERPPLASMHQPMSSVASPYFGTSGSASYSSSPAWAPTYLGTSGSASYSSAPALASTYLGTSGGTSYSSSPAWAPTFAGHEPHPRQYGAQAGPSMGASNCENRAPAMQAAPFGHSKAVVKQEPISVSQVGTSSQQQQPPSSRPGTPYPRESLREVHPVARIDPLTRREASDAQQAGRETQRSQHWWEDGS